MKVAGASGGAAAGGAIGASIGSLIFPLAGTLIGGGVGAFIGALGVRELIDDLIDTWKWGDSRNAYEYFAEKFGNVAIMNSNRTRHGIAIIVHNVPEIFRINLLRQLRRSDKIAEHDG